MKLTINYTNGNTIAQIVHYAHVENEKLYFVMKRKSQSAFPEQIAVPLKNVKSFEVNEEDVK